MSTQGPCSESIDNVGVCICAAVERCLAAAAPNAALPTPPVLGDVYVTSKRGMLFLQHRWTRQLLLRPRHAASSADAANAAMACSDVFVTPAAWPRQRWVRGVVSIQSRSFEPDAPLTFTTSIDNMVSDMADEKDGDDEQVWCLSDDATQPQRQQRVHDADGNASSTTTTTAASTTATRRPSHGRRANMRVCLRAVPVLLPPYNSSSSRSARALFWYEQLLQQQQLSYYHHQQQQQQQQHQQQQLRGMYALDNRLQPQQQLLLQQGHSARATAVTCASIMRAREAVLLHDLLQTVDRLLQYMAQTSTDATHDDTTATAVVDNNNSSSFCCTTTSNGHARGGDGEHAAESSDGSEDDEAHDAYVCSIDVPVYCARVAATDNAATRLSELAPYTDAFLRACVVHDDCNDTHRSNDAAADANNNDDDDDDDDADVTVSPSPLRQPCHRHHGRRGRVLVHDSTCALAVLCDCLDVLTSCATTTATHARTGSDNNNSNSSNHDACRADGDRQSATTRVRTVLVALRAFLACACDEAETQLEKSMCERRKSSETRDDSRNRRRDGAAAAHGDDATPVSATRRACEEQLIAALHDTGIARDVAGATVCTRTRRDDDNNNSNGTEHATAHGDTSTTVARRFAPASGVLVHCTRGESRSVSLVLLFFLCLLRPLLRRLHRQGVTAPAAPPPCAQASRDDSNDAGKAAGSTSTATSAAAGTTPAPASSASVAVTAVDTSSLYNNLSVVWLLMAMRVARPSVRPHISFMAEINRLWHCLIEHDDDVDLWQTINSGGHDGGCGCLHCDACTCGDGGGRGMY